MGDESVCWGTVESRMVHGNSLASALAVVVVNSAMVLVGWQAGRLGWIMAVSFSCTPFPVHGPSFRSLLPLP